MANWKSKVVISDLHRKYCEGEMMVAELGVALAGRLEKNPYAEEIGHLIEELEDVKDVEHYDSILDELYSFGDHQHRIWIENF